MKRIEIRTTHEDSKLVARSVSPDNTPEIRTRTDDEQVVTTVERESTGGLRTTADDYVVNLTIAVKTAQLSDQITKPNYE